MKGCCKSTTSGKNLSIMPPLSAAFVAFRLRTGNVLNGFLSWPASVHRAKATV